MPELDAVVDTGGGGGDAGASTAVADHGSNAGASGAEPISVHGAAPPSAHQTPNSAGDEYDFGPPEEFGNPTPSGPAAAPTGEQGGQRATTAAPAASPTPVAPTFAPELLARAQNIGMQPTQIAALKDAAQLEAAVTASEAVAFRMLQIAGQQQQAARQQQQQVPQLQPPPAFDAAANKKALLEKGFDESYADELVARDKLVHDMRVADFQNKSAIVEMARMVQGQQQLSQQQMQQTLMQQVNDQFSSFVGGLSEKEKALAQDPINRAEILKTADFLATGMAAKGIPVPANLGTLFRQATNVVLGDKTLSIAREQVRAEVQTHQNRAVSKPRDSGAQLSGNREERAAQVADAFYAKWGLAPHAAPAQFAEAL